MSISKRHRENKEAVDSEARYELSQAITILQSSKKTKFEERFSAKQKGDFKLADQIRSELLDKGVIIEDQKGKTTWKFK